MASSSGGNYYELLDPGDSARKSPNQKRKKSEVNINSTTSFPLLGHKTPQFKVQCPKFVIIKSTVPEKPINNFNIFLVSKALENICAEPPQQISFTRDGNLLVLTKNDMQTNKFLKAKNLANVCPIISELHPTLNTVKGVIFAPSLRLLSDKEIVEGLRDQAVTECQKIKKFVDGELVNTSLHIISFQKYEIPKEIKIGFLICKVEPYIQAPIQCKNCFKLGHTKKYCRSDEKCEVCSANVHEPTTCKEVKCINCSHAHRANNRNCPVIQARAETIKIKTITKCTYKTAIEKVKSQAKVYDIPTETLEKATELRQKRLSSQSKIIPNNQSNNAPNSNNEKIHSLRTHENHTKENENTNKNSTTISKKITTPNEINNNNCTTNDKFYSFLKQSDSSVRQQYLQYNTPPNLGNSPPNLDMSME